MNIQLRSNSSAKEFAFGNLEIQKASKIIR